MTRNSNPLGLSPVAEDAWRHLTLTADDTVPCRGPRTAWWTSDDPEEREGAAHQCAACPITQLCSTYADQAGERFHVWAGVDRTRRPATSRRTA